MTFWRCLWDTLSGKAPVEFYTSGELVRYYDGGWFEGVLVWKRSCRGRILARLFDLFDRIANTGTVTDNYSYVHAQRRFGPLLIHSGIEWGGHYGSIGVYVGRLMLLSIAYDVYHYYWEGYHTHSLYEVVMFKLCEQSF